MKAYLTIKEALALAADKGKSLSRRYLAKLCQDGAIGSYKAGGGRRGVWLVNRKSFEQWLDDWHR